MATKTKDGGSSSSLKKEKKATPSSNSQTATIKQANLKPVTGKEKSTPPSSSSKAVPNYLRPTYSSRTESLKLGKKTNNINITGDSSGQKLLRRRSFDNRPPSASAVGAQKSLTSPDPRERLATRDRIAPSRSTNSVSASRLHNKPVLERNSKSLKPVRPQQPAAPSSSRSITRCKSLTKNAHSTKSPSSITSSNNQDTPQDLDVELTKQEILIDGSNLDQEAEVDRDEVVVPSERNDEDVNIALEDISQVKDSISDEDEKLQISEISTVEEAPNVSHQEVEVHQELCEVEDDHRDEGDYQDHKEESNDNQLAEEGIIDDDTSKVESITELDKEEEDVSEKVAAISSEEAVDKGKEEEIKSKEVAEKAVEGGGEGGNPQVGNEMQKKQGKKESPAAYNDVIEETKNKLLEKRKNKVKALVGAFETVIDYETAAGSNK